VEEVTRQINRKEDFVLTLTDSATTEIRNLIATNPEVPDGAGVRIAREPGAGNLTLSLALTPAEDDTVVDSDGARVFVEQTTVPLLDDKTLDAQQDGNGQVQFAIAQQ
jgi:Fe-S cluster assembly iron-binding protein IscA